MWILGLKGLRHLRDKKLFYYLDIYFSELL